MLLNILLSGEKQWTVSIILMVNNKKVENKGSATIFKNKKSSHFVSLY